MWRPQSIGLELNLVQV